MKIWYFSCLQCPKCLVLVVELSYHQYKESSNEMPIKSLLQNDFSNASLQQGSDKNTLFETQKLCLH